MLRKMYKTVHIREKERERERKKNKINRIQMKCMHKLGTCIHIIRICNIEIRKATSSKPAAITL